MVTTGAHTIWETISNTVALRPSSFYLVLDEAHRGMKESARSRTQAETIVQKFIKGSPGEIPAIPIDDLGHERNAGPIPEADGRNGADDPFS